MSQVLIGMGSNAPWLGDSPARVMVSAFAALGRVFGAGRLSPLYRSVAWPDPNDPPFVNAVAVFDKTALPPLACLASTQAMEAAFGRRRWKAPDVRYAARTLDLDLLDVGGTKLTIEALHLPHPRIAARAFVLKPLFDVRPHWHDPVTGLTAAAALSQLPVKDQQGTVRLPFTGT